MASLGWRRLVGVGSVLAFGACSHRIEDTGGVSSPAAIAAGGDGGADPAPAAEGGAPPEVTPTLPRGPLPPAVPPCTTDLGPELARLTVPGLSAGIVKNGKLVCTAVAGQANIEESRPVTPDTVFVWASVSKTVTAVTLMTLFDEGKFKLDDSIDGFLPFRVSVPSCPTQSITFRQLFTHTSSIIENEDQGVYADSYVKGDSPIALGDFLQGYLMQGGTYFDASKNFAPGCPGTINSYSNVGAALIGYLGEVMAKVSFADLADARVFQPLGMNESSFRLRSFDASHVAMPYRGDPGSFAAVGQTGFPTYPDGLLRTSVPQLARFLVMFSQFGELDGAQVLAHSTAEEMRRVQIPNLDDTQGLIWYYDDFDGRPKVLGHNGSDPGVSSNMFFDPADGAGVLLVANGEWDDAQADALVAKLFLEAKQH